VQEAASAQRRWQWRARSEGGGGGSGKRGAATAAAAAWRAASGERQRRGGASGSSSSNSAAYFFLFPNGATPPGLKPAVMVRTVGSETGGDGPIHHQRVKSNAPQNRR